ncbi:FAD-dependent oxidoreductase [Aureliella helgolandensis]|uniref:Fumarate reductase flavoprotein subunit n=1 Tax=Aureliella helgolandensis TaxID=2527968 RepID=A0A518G9E1_9BACT|nr:FAD-dependent oxidoreductase [Aureliella helgolandensis]QDV25218.1 Fumarate reductase flavoprotein subunit [Aureliella helgolandensis]
MKTILSLCLSISLLGTLCAAPPDSNTHNNRADERDVDERHVIVVGTGMAGLSAALEAAQNGARVTVLEKWSVFGGTSFISGGKLAIVGTELQKSKGIEDSPDLAFQDFVNCGKDLDREWVRYYVDHSNEEIFEWLSEAGVKFDIVAAFPRNSVPRGHGSKELGVGLINPLFRTCFQHPNVEFVWNTKVVDLVRDQNEITGVKGVDTRSGTEREFLADAVVLATGGFQSNLKMIRENWPSALPWPSRVLTGSGINSLGIGHGILREAGAAYHRMSYVWNYPYGLPDPRDPSGKRGLLFAHGRAIWLNGDGQRFVSESADIEAKLNAMLRQTPASYWALFDESNKTRVYVAGTDFGNFAVVQRVIYDNPKLVKSAMTLESLAEAAGLPQEAMAETVRRYNAMVDAGNDADFHRFSLEDSADELPPKIETPPFYAVQIYPMTRKNMGGVLTDHSCRVLDAQDRPIPRLYAAGELSGFAGINGTSALEGTFLGPCVVTGRMAARTAVADAAALHRARRPAAPSQPPQPSQTSLPLSQPSQELEPVTDLNTAASNQCIACHDIKSLVGMNRPGYLHFEKSHQRVLDRELNCSTCHPGMNPYQKDLHRIDMQALSHHCGTCHLSKD